MLTKFNKFYRRLKILVTGKVQLHGGPFDCQWRRIPRIYGLVGLGYAAIIYVSRNTTTREFSETRDFGEVNFGPGNHNWKNTNVYRGVYEPVKQENFYPLLVWTWTNIKIWDKINEERDLDAILAILDNLRSKCSSLS